MEPATWPIMVGIVAVAMEGNQLVIPIHKSLRARDRERFPQAPIGADFFRSVGGQVSADLGCSIIVKIQAFFVGQFAKALF